ncbi:MAG: septal ring lytic transglycosylase RlpA family protein [Bacteroidota bacterium]
MIKQGLLFLVVILLCQVANAQVQTGLASYYDDKFDGRTTASGEVFDQNKATAAHRTLPFGTKVKVTNVSNQKSTVVIINDRGPFIRGRIIDLSKSIAEELDFLGDGTTEVEIEVIDGDEQHEIGIQKDIAKTQEVETPDNQKPSKKEKESVQKQPEEKALEQERRTTQKITPKTLENTHSKSTFYTLKAEKIEPSFIGVQIGSFKDATNLIELTSHLKTSFEEHITVQVKNYNGSQVYTIILGKYENRLGAERFLKKVRKDYPDAFIVDMIEK